jgi:hypothetical protein
LLELVVSETSVKHAFDQAFKARINDDSLFFFGTRGFGFKQPDSQGYVFVNALGWGKKSEPRAKRGMTG